MLCGKSAVKQRTIPLSFMARSVIWNTENRRFQQKNAAAPALTSQGSQVQSLPRPPFFHVKLQAVRPAPIGTTLPAVAVKVR